MFKIGAERLAALSGAAATFSEADYEQAVAHPRLVKIKENKALISGILENTLQESEAHKGRVAIGHELATLYTRGEMYDPDMQNALTDLVYLAMPADVKIAYRKKLPATKKGEKDSPAMAKLKKARHAARKRVSNTVKKIIHAAYPTLAAKETPSEKADKEADAEKELEELESAGGGEGGGSRYVEEAREDGRSRVSSGASSRMDGEEDDEDEEDDGGVAFLAKAAAGGAGSVASSAKKQGKKDAADFERDRQPVFAINQVYAEKASLIHAQATELGFQHCLAVLRETKPDGITYVNVPEGTHNKTTDFLSVITATFHPDGSLTEAAQTAKQGTLPVDWRARTSAFSDVWAQDFLFNVHV